MSVEDFLTNGTFSASLYNVNVDGTLLVDGSPITAPISQSFNPNLLFEGVNAGITGAFPAHYTLIGNMVAFNIGIILTNKGAAPGNATITLPFAPIMDISFSVGLRSGLATGSAENVVVVCTAGSTTGTFFFIPPTTGVAVTATNASWTNTTTLNFGGVYFTS